MLAISIAALSGIKVKMPRLALNIILIILGLHIGNYIDQNLISNIKVFDVYEGENIPENQKSVAINLTIQSSNKTLNDNDLENINNSIIKSVESKTGAKIRS